MVMRINVTVPVKKIEEQKKEQNKKIPYIYDRKWRDKSESEAPKDIKPTIRFKSKIEGTTILKDLVQGDVEIENNTIEDFIILETMDLQHIIYLHQLMTIK